MNGVRWSLESPSGVGAVAVIVLTGPTPEELDRTLEELEIGSVGVGTLALRDFLGVDRGVFVRWSPTSAALMPHGGGAVVRALCEALSERRVARAERTKPGDMYPEASGELEAAMLAALGRAHSPLAVSLLLDQPRRWSRAGAASDAERDLILRRLIEPPLVVALGASNIGKSTLANALAGRQVSLVADEPGTTRDHVGVMLDLAGLVVRYVDTPGVRDGAPAAEAEAARIAREVAERADLILLCCDAGSLPVDVAGFARAPNVLRVGLRSDLGLPCGPVDVEVSVRRPESLSPLVDAVRERLVPGAALAHPGPWRFWHEGEVEGIRP